MAIGQVFNIKNMQMRILAIYLISIFVFYSCDAQDKSKLELNTCIDSISYQGNDIGFIISNRYILFGKIDTVYSDNEKGFSDFHILDTRYSDNNKYRLSGKLFCDPTRSFCLPKEYVKVRKENVKLNLTYYLTVPCGKGWKYELQPIMRQDLTFNEDSLFLISEKFILKSGEQFLNPKEQVVQDYKIIKDKGINSYFKNQQGAEFVMDFQMRLIISAFYDDTCEKLLVNLPDDFPELTEGLPGEIYYSWAIIYNLYAKENNKPLILFP